MTTRNRTMAATFAHLLGLGVRAEEEDKDKKGSRAEDDYEKKGRRAEEDDKDDGEDDKEKKGKKAKRAEGDDKDECAEDDDDAERAEEDDKDDGEDDKEKKGKKAKRAEDDDDDEEMSGNSASAKARRRERARCAAIFASPAAGIRPDVAAHVAFNTNMSRGDAIAMLDSVSAGHQAPSRQGLGSRMADAAVPHVGSSPGPGAAQSNLSPVAKAIIAAGDKARP